MGIRCTCPNGHKLNVKEFLAGKRAVCPSCGARFVIPASPGVNGGAVVAPPAELGVPSVSVLDSSDAQPSAAADAPSVLIPVVEPPSPPAQSSAASSPPPTALPALDFAAIATAPAPPPVSKYAVRHQRSRRLQMQTAVVLLLAVIVLAVVLIWVLNRGPTEATSAVHNPAHLASAPTQAYVAKAGHLF